MPIVPGEPAPIAGQGFELVFEDDFDTLDTSIWVPEPWYEGKIDPARTTVANSILTLASEYPPTAPYNERTTLASIGPSSPSYPHRPNAKAWQEGYFEIRARTTVSPWGKLALWFNSLETVNRHPEWIDRDCTKLNCEWDMVENGIRNWVGPAGYADVNHVSVCHRNTTGAFVVCDIPDVGTNYHVAGTGLCDWHTWGGLWTGSDVSTYLDGVLLGSQPAYDTFNQPMYMLLTAAPTNSTPAGTSDPRPASVETDIDWVRVWQRPPNALSARRSVTSFTGVTDSNVSTPDHPSLNITGDIDLRIDVALDDWTPPAEVTFECKYVTTGNQRSYRFVINTAGKPAFVWSEDGTTTFNAICSDNLASLTAWERRAVRVTMDVDNGATQHVVQFYTAPTMQGPWTTLGSAITQAGTTSIFESTAPVEIGSFTNGTLGLLTGNVYAAQIRDGIDGPIVTHVDFTDKTPGTRRFADQFSHPYTVNSTARIIQDTPRPDMYATASPQRLSDRK